MKNKAAFLGGGVSLAVLLALIVTTLDTQFFPILIWVLPLPLMYVFSKFGWRSGTAVFFCGCAALLILNQTAIIIVVAFFMLLGAAMGAMIYLKKSALAVLMLGSFAGTAIFIAGLAIALTVFHYDPVNAITAQLLSTFDATVRQASSALSNDQLRMLSIYRDVISDLVYYTPSLLVSSATGIALIVELISLPVLRLLRVSAPHWRPFRRWHVTKSVVWIYLFVLLVLYFNLYGDKGSAFFNIAVNFQYMLGLLLIIQGFSFFYEIAHQRRWPLIVPIFLTFAGLLLLDWIKILGIIDLGFDMRKRFNRKV
ncbi:MAG: DUF2232 domain-containing protein [Sporolactobacillus sp.]